MSIGNLEVVDNEDEKNSIFIVNSCFIEIRDNVASSLHAVRKGRDGLTAFSCDYGFPTVFVYLFCTLTVPHGVQDLSCPTRD